MRGSAEQGLLAIGTLDRFGDVLRRAAIPVAIYVHTNSALAVGLAAATSFLPSAMMVAISARFGAPSRARTSLVQFNIARAAVSAAMVLLAARESFGIWFYFSILVLSALTAVVDTSFGSTIRSVSPKGDLQRVNARLAVWQNGVAAVVGMPLGGLLGFVFPPAAFAIDACTYIGASAIAGSDLLGPVATGKTHDLNDSREGDLSVAAAWGWLRASKLHRSIVFGVATMNLASGSVFGSLVVIATERFDISQRLFGFVPLLWSVSVTACSMYLSRRTVSYCLLLVGAPALQVAGYALLIPSENVVALVAFLVGVGLASAAWNAASSARMQADPPAVHVSGVLAIWKSISLAAASGGAAVGGLLLSQIQFEYVFGGASLLCLGASLLVRAGSR